VRQCAERTLWCWRQQDGSNPALDRQCTRALGELDHPAMVAVLEDSKEVDGLERTDTVDDVARFYDNLINCDPYQDMLFADLAGKKNSNQILT
jgi:hypothetical protein